MNPITNFMENAKGMTRNPLGIIALFVSLIYGFACLVLSSSLKNLQGPEESLPLIWFIIAFPLLILIGFIYLVVNHHEKLYAPSDYKDETNFIKTLDAKKQTQRLLTEVEAIKEDIKEVEIKSPNIAENIEVKIVENEKTDNIKSKYLIAEDLSLKAFEQEKGIQVKRQIKLLLSNNSVIEFDGVATDNKTIYGIDVKYTIHQYLSKTLRKRLLDQFNFYKTKTNSFRGTNEFKIVIVIVTESENLESLKRELGTLKTDFNVEAEFIVYSFLELKSRFGLD